MSEKSVIIPEDYKDLIYRFTYFLLGKLAKYIPSTIRPNQITIVSFISALVGTALLYFVNSPAAYLYWVLFNFIWYILDALDGIHARLTGQTSEYGGFLDHALDNIYFVIMLTVFAAKFDLTSTFYIFILLLRVTAAVMVFIVQCHTKRVYLMQFSGGFELLFLSVVMFLSYAFPHFNPVYHTHNPVLLYWIHWLNLEQGMFMKLMWLIYLIAIPITFVLQFRFVKRELP